MTVAVYSKNVLAIDRGAATSDVIHRVEKFRVIDDKSIVVAVGSGQRATMLLNWAEQHKLDPDKFPDKLRGMPCEAYLLHITSRPQRRSGGFYSVLFRYENSPHPIEHGSTCCAFGEGRDFAYGALHHGASAVEAAKAACYYSTYCSAPIDFFRVSTVTGRIEHDVCTL